MYALGLQVRKCPSPIRPSPLAPNITSAHRTAPGLYCKRSSDLSASRTSTYLRYNCPSDSACAMFQPWVNLTRARAASHLCAILSVYYGVQPALAADGPTVAHKAERQLVLPHSILSTSISPMLAIPSCLPCNNYKWCVGCCSKNYMVVWMCALGVKLATADAMLPVEPACAAVERDTQNVASC